MMLLETVRIEDGKPCNIKQHNRRFNRTRKELFGIEEDFDLKKVISPPIKEGIFRCRITYKDKILAIEYIPYKPKTFHKFKIIQSDIDYKYKYINRMGLEQLKAESLPFDDIIIEKDGFLTDTTIANIAFYDGDFWLTPQKPLLEGTMRNKLLEEGKLIEGDIRQENLDMFSHFAIMNAMVGFQIQKNIIIEGDKKKYWL